MRETQEQKTNRRFWRNEVLRRIMLRAHENGVSWGSMRDLTISLEHDEENQ